MKALIIPNLSKKNSHEVTCEVIDFLHQHQWECYMDSHFIQFENHPKVTFGPIGEMIKECDYVIAIGGDGTIIQCAKYAVNEKKPIIGINVGRLGFLASLEKQEVHKLSHIISGDYVIEERMLLEVTIESAGKEKKMIALNDVVISKNVVGKLIDLEVACEGKKVGNYRGDGMILSTPTGSTAYTMSAGGPVIDPSLSCLVMTPVSPHSLVNRSMLFSDDKTLEVSAQYLNDVVKVAIFIDGGEGIEISKDDVISIKKSKQTVQLLSIEDRTFFERVNQKIKDRL